jgi:hypothetical protein
MEAVANIDSKITMPPIKVSHLLMTSSSVHPAPHVRRDYADCDQKYDNSICTGERGRHGLKIGYPNGLWDEFNNIPFFMKGITATHPNINYKGNL